MERRFIARLAIDAPEGSASVIPDRTLASAIVRSFVYAEESDGLCARLVAAIERRVQLLNVMREQEDAALDAALARKGLRVPE